MECPECQFINPDEFTFCGRCGHRFCEPSEIERTLTTAEGERKHVTVLFSDLSGYTSMCEKLDPEEVKEIMSLIFGDIAQVVTKYEGFIEKFIGDAVVALFGVPKAHEDDPVRAIRAAREVHDLVEAFSPQLETKIGKPLSMHTGINTGLVVTGEVDLEKGTHGVAGDTINLAARFCSLAKPGEIVVGLDTCRQAGGHFTFTALEPTAIKGKMGPVQTYIVASLRVEPRKIHRLQGLRADLIGRDAQMAQLVEAVENLRRGEGSVVAITGDAGTGKSRLIEEFKTVLDLDEIQWREGHAYAYSQKISYFPMIDLLNRALQIDEGDSPENVREKVESGVEHLVGKREDVIPYIGSLLSLSYPEAERMSPDSWKLQLQKAIRTILSALVQRAPTIICLEDLHWADPSSLDLLRFILSEFTNTVLFLCVYRPPFTLFSSHQLSAVGKAYREIQIQDLSTTEAQDMTESLLRTKTVPEELRRFIQEKVEGNPFYLEEAINSLIETERLVRDNGNWRLVESIGEFDISPTIQGVIAARIDRLERDSKRILQEASVIGRAFLYEILKRVTELKDYIDESLTELERLDLIRAKSLQPDLEYIFKHALIQEVVYNGLLKSERILIHEQIGLVIEQLFQDRLPEFYETLAYHFKQSQLDRKAVEYLIRSGEKSLKRYALEESHRYYDEAFNIMANRPLESEEDKSLLVNILIEWSLVHYFRGDFINLLELLSSQKDIVDSITDKSKKGMYYAWLGFTLYIREKYNDSYEHLMESLKLGEEINDRMLEGYACTWLIYLCGDLGLFDDSMRFAERALTIAETEKSDPYLFFKSLGGIVQTCFYTGNAPKSSEVGAVLLKFGKQQANVRGMVMGYIGLGISDMIAGNFYSSIKHFKKAIEVSADPFYGHVASYALGAAYVLGEDFSKAEVVLQEVIAYGSKHGADWAITPATMFRGVVQILSGKMTLGLRKINSSLEQFKKKGRKPYIALTEYTLGKIYYMMANPKDRIAIKTIIKNLFFILKHRPYAIKKAEKHFNCAIVLAQEIGAKSILAQSYLDMGFLKRKQLKTAEAIKFFSLAASLFEECKAEVYVKQARDALEDFDR